MDSSQLRRTLNQLLSQAESVVSEQETLADGRKQLESDIARCRADIEKLDREFKTAESELADWQVKWTAATQSLGCDENATAGQANERLNYLTQLFQNVNEIASKKKRIADVDADAERFAQAVGRLAGQFLDGDELPPDELVLKLAEILRVAEKDRERLEQLNEDLTQDDAELTAATEKQQTLQHQLESLCSMAGVEDVASLPEIERASHLLADYRGQLDGIEEQLHGLSGNASIDEFVTAAKEWDADELRVRIGSLDHQVEELKTIRDKAVIAVRDLENEAREADGNADAAEKDQEALGLIARMQSDAARYMRLRLAATILRQQIEKHRAENEDPLLRRASTLFARMTCNEFSGIRTDFENDDPVIVGVRKSNDELVPVTAMSTGTRDQLYLALRLGYVERQLVDHEPMPFIVDDILIQFDPARSRATLEVLAELAKQTQVIFFTHHWHLVELAKEGLPADECFVHHLDSRDRESSNSMASTRPR